VNTDTATAPAEAGAVDTATPAAEEEDGRCDTGDAENPSIDQIAESERPDSDEPDSDDVEAVERYTLSRRIGRINWPRFVAFFGLPLLVVILAGGAGYLRWQDSCTRESKAAAISSVAAAKEITVAILSYQPDSVGKDLGSAGNRLTGTFKDAYSQLVRDVVIPGAKQRHIGAVAAIPAAATVSATPTHAVVLLFVNQTVTVGNDPPSDTASTVKVTLDKVQNRWLMSAFDPI
jgi:Mce-associated membrane protein